MNQYLIDTKFASASLINTIYFEEDKLTNLTKEFEVLKKGFDHLSWDFLTSDMNEDFNELQVQHKFNMMAQFSEQNDMTDKKTIIDNLEKSIIAKNDSINTLSMCLLQVAKQGISTVYGNPSNCPSGRNIGSSETLKNVIWQSRNQSIHCEEGTPKQKVKDCFINLTKDFGDDFNLTLDFTLNKARMIIGLMNWVNYENYEKDMISLIG